MEERLSSFRLGPAVPAPAPLSEPEYCWPVNDHKQAWPVYRGEAAHISDGEGPAWDAGNQEGLPLVAIADCDIIQATSDPHKAGGFHAGNLIIYECTVDGARLRVHYCHMQALEVSADQHFPKGAVLGHVGHTGTGLDAAGNLVQMTQANSHLHLWTEQLASAGWQRVWPSAVLRDSLFS